MITDGRITRYEEKDYVDQRPKGGLEEILARVRANNLRMDIRYQEGRLDQASDADRAVIAEKIEQLKQEHDDIMRQYMPAEEEK